MVVRGTNGGDGVFTKSKDLVNGKVLYETSLEDRFVVFQEGRFSVLRNDSSERQGLEFNTKVGFQTLSQA